MQNIHQRSFLSFLFSSNLSYTQALIWHMSIEFTVKKFPFRMYTIAQCSVCQRVSIFASCRVSIGVMTLCRTRRSSFCFDEWKGTAVCCKFMAVPVPLFKIKLLLKSWKKLSLAFYQLAGINKIQWNRLNVDKFSVISKVIMWLWKLIKEAHIISSENRKKKITKNKNYFCWF